MSKILHSADLPAAIPDYKSGGFEPEALGHPAEKGGDIPFKQMEDRPKPSPSDTVLDKAELPTS